MYLSKVILDVWGGQSALVLTDFYRAHQFVAAACPPGTDTPRTLFRIEQDGQTPWLLVQSPSCGDWDRATHMYGVDIIEVQSKAFDMAKLISRGQLVRFRLRANPVRTIKAADRSATQKPGKPARNKNIRVPLIHEVDQRDWLQRRMKSAGLEVVQAEVRDEGSLVKGGPREQRNRNRMRIQSVRFDGLARVSDVDHAIRAVHDGIGPAKGFGFGLLSIAPTDGP